MDGIAQDLKLALRVFWKHPGFAAIVILTLALGSGANTAIFTLLDQVMLRMLPVERPERLVVLSGPGPFSGWSEQNGSATPFSHPMFERHLYEITSPRERTRLHRAVVPHHP